MNNLELRSKEYTLLVNNILGKESIELITALKDNGCDIQVSERELTAEFIKNNSSKCIISLENDIVKIVNQNENRILKRTFNDFIKEINPEIIESIH